MHELATAGKKAPLFLLLFLLSFYPGSSLIQAQESAASFDVQLILLLDEFIGNLGAAGYTPPILENEVLGKQEISLASGALFLYIDFRLQTLLEKRNASLSRSGGASRPRGPADYIHLENSAGAADIALFLPGLRNSAGRRFMKDRDLLALLGEPHGDTASFFPELKGSGNQPIPIRRQDGRDMVALRSGEEFSVTVQSRSDKPVRAAVYLNGVNQISGALDLPSLGQRASLPPGQSVTFNRCFVPAQGLYGLITVVIYEGAELTGIVPLWYTAR
ncbi:hypothetical protein [Treponema primitia]|uniref:hypothetical protein n=1 Tax=Treponema primitia TaxID=88058 RepID=UPI0002555651|nr:hypothetical protein [Treponema primitia]